MQTQVGGLIALTLSLIAIQCSSETPDPPSEVKSTASSIRVLSNDANDNAALPLIVENPENGKTGDIRSFNVVNSSALGNLSIQKYNLETITNAMSAEISIESTRGILNPSMELSAVTSEEEETGIFPSQGNILDNIGIKERRRNKSAEEEVMSNSNSLDFFVGVDSNCLDSSYFEVGKWGDGRPFNEQVSELRRNLYLEFDEIDPAAQVSLMQLYLHFGFGAEALSIGRLSPINSAEFAVLRLLANLLEYGASVHTFELGNYSECEGAITLWSILAKGDEFLISRSNLNSALQELYSLPVHLQSIVAPELSRKLRTSGYFEEASTALRVLYRGSGTVNDSAQFQHAELLVEFGDRSAAEEILLEISRTNSVEAAGALVRYIDLVADERGSLSNTIVELAEVYARELRQAEIGPEIARAHAIALAKSGDFEGSYETMQDAKGLQIDSGAFLGKFYDILSNEADDFDFVKRALSITPEEVISLPSTTKFRVSRRLHDLGFSEQANAMLDDVPTSIFPKEQRLLRAKLANSLGQFGQAIELLADDDDVEAKKVLAEAFENSGSTAQAYRLYNEIGMAERAEEVIWESAEDFPLDFDGSAAAERLIELVNGTRPEAVAGQLAQTRELIASTERLNSEISTLLSSLELP